MQTLQVASAEDLVSGIYGHWGIYGQNGIGKTWVARSIPPSMPTLVVSADLENVKPLRGLSHIKIVKVDHWNDLGKILSLLQRGLLLPNGRPDPDILTGKRQFFRSVVFDTWTRIQALAVNKVIGYERLSPQDAIKFLNVAPKTPKGWEAWQQVGALTGEWMRYFEELPIHCLFLFQEGMREGLDENRNTINLIGPDLTPSALRHAKDTLEIIGRLYVTLGADPDLKQNGDEKNEEVSIEALLDGAAANPSLKWMDPQAREVRNLLIGKHPQFFAKGPTHKLGRIIPDFTFEHLIRSLEP